MRKRLTGEVAASRPDTPRADEWLDLENLARVEVTSEDAAHPVEGALLTRREKGWRAAHSGEQTIRIFFDQPHRIRHIELVFEEREVERSQEFTLRWRPDGAREFRDIVRQQWNFTPSGSVREVENYRVDLVGASELALTIVPDRSGGPACASLTEWRMA